MIKLLNIYGGCEKMDQTIKVMIVDDSMFSIVFLRDILQSKGFEVVGSASSLPEVKEQTRALKPDLVTMDMTIPGTDGLECTRAVHEVDSNIKVIMISSMMDDEILRQAKRNHISGFLQKPVDPDELELLIKRTLADDEIYHTLLASYADVFQESLSGTFTRMLKKAYPFERAEKIEAQYNSKGISVIISLAGKCIGRMILDASEETATKLACAIMRTNKMEINMVIECISEFVNICAGNACSVLNRSNTLYGLRVTPPTIFYGEQVNISKTNLESEVAFTVMTDFGEIYYNVGFRRGETEWTQTI